MTLPPTDFASAAQSSPVVIRHGSARPAEPPYYAPRPVQHPRLSLQRRAPSTLRRHVARAAGRLAVLLTADLAGFATLREL